MDFKKLFNEYRFIIFATIGFLVLILLVFSGYKYFLEYKEPETVDKPVSKAKVDNELIKEEVSTEINSYLPDVKEYFNIYDDLNDFPTVSYYDENEEEIAVDLTKVGTYNVKIKYHDNEYKSTLNVIDTTPPDVTFKELSIKEGERYIARNFVQYYKDNSKEKGYSVSYKDSTNANITRPGTYNIDLSVCDNYKNCTEGSTKLTIFYNNSNKKYVKSEKENLILKEETIKYGVKKITSTDVTYSYYDDGSKDEISRDNEVVSYDYSGFNHDYINEMKKEALSIYNDQGFTRTDILSTINNYRRDLNVAPLSLNREMSVLAIIRAMELAYSNRVSHERPYEEEKYKQWKSIFLEKICDVNIDYRVSIAESIGSQQESDKAMADYWRSSTEASDIMLNPKYTKTGIGKYTLDGVDYWVQLYVEK